MIWIGARWPSTWSRPAWESSSTRKIAESFQYLLCEIVSTSLPTARSLSATWAAAFGGGAGVVAGEPEHVQVRRAVLLEVLLPDLVPVDVRHVGVELREPGDRHVVQRR